MRFYGPSVNPQAMRVIPTFTNGGAGNRGLQPSGNESGPGLNVDPEHTSAVTRNRVPLINIACLMLHLARPVMAEDMTAAYDCDAEPLAFAGCTVGNGPAALSLASDEDVGGGAKSSPPPAAVPPPSSGGTTLAADDSRTPLRSTDMGFEEEQGDLRRTRWDLCPPEPRRTVPVTPPMGREEAPIHMSADRAEGTPGKRYTLTGDARIQRADQELRADTISYDRERDTADAAGDVHYDDADMTITGDEAHLRIDAEEGSIENVDYRLYPRHARGGASTVYLEGPDRKRLMDSSYTTCPRGSKAWLLSARQVKLLEDKGEGRARDATLALGGVPVLYTPFISFPIDDRRKSGLLLPKFGNSESTGYDFRIPYYWNIAPDRDATITPRYMTKRGLLLGGEFRYLNPHSSGELGVEYIADDREYGGARNLSTLQNLWKPTSRLSTRIFASRVSDKQYFEDLGDNLDISSITNLEQVAEARYHGNGWDMFGRFQNFQTVDDTIAPVNYPYKRLPELRFTANPRIKTYGLRYALDSTFTNFEHQERVTGTRFDIEPRINLPLGRAGYYLNPTAAVRYTDYALRNTAPAEEKSPSRFLPVVSVDSGMFFDRDIELWSRDYVQTLEPRAYYLYVPYENQDDIPIFDTSQYDPSFWLLFEDNRFSGPDRVGDANQLSLALTSRLVNPATGAQRMSASVGQIRYFRDRRVTLPGAPVETTSGSDLIGEFSMALSPAWETTASILWDPSETQTDIGTVRLQYHPGGRRVINLSYRYRRDILTQTDVSVLWPLGRSWHAVGRWYYSLKDNLTLEGIAGLEYESCCWVLRIIGRNYVNTTSGAQNRSIYVQLELKGLTNIGHSVERLLERSIRGYLSNP
jgi:LPS-assembly protein